MSAKSMTNISLRIEQETKDAVVRIAKDHDSNMSYIVGSLIKLLVSCYDNPVLCKKSGGVTSVDLPVRFVNPNAFDYSDQDRSQIRVRE